MNKWKIVARHQWVSQAVITESLREADGWRRFTATILGYRNWRLWQGPVAENDWPHILATVMAKVVGIRERIVAGDESVWTDPEVQAW